MLGNIISKYFIKYLGKYVEEFDKKNVETSLSSGESTFRNLILKSSTFNKFNLPLTITKGTISRLSLKVPWRSLGSKPTTIHVDDLILVVKPDDPSKKITSEEELIQHIKLQKLKLAKMLNLDQPKEEDDEEDIKKKKKKKKKKKGFLRTLKLKILNNLQIFINNIHIQYEDETNDFVFGFKLEKFHFQSCDEHFKPCISKLKDLMTYKLIEIENFLIYCDPLNSNNKEKDVNKHHYIIEPLTATIKVSINQQMKMNEYPKYKFQIDLDSMDISIDSNQYQSTKTMINSMSSIFNHHRQTYSPYHSLKPKESPSEKPHQWWKYLICRVSDDVKKKKTTFSWDSIMSYKKDRSIYTVLYSKKLKYGKHNLTVDEINQLKEIETIYSYETLLLFRKIANSLLKKKKDQGGISIHKKKEYIGSKLSKAIKSMSEKEEFLKELYESMDYDESNSESSSVVRDINEAGDIPKFGIDLNIRRSNICIIHKEMKLYDLLINYLKVSFTKRSESFSLFLNLGNIQLKESIYSKTKECIKENIIIKTDMLKNKIIELQLDQNPTDKSCNNTKVDYSVKIRSMPINVYVSYHFVKHLIRFIQREKDFDGIKMISSKINELKKKGFNNFKKVLRKRKVIDFDIDIVAPTFTIPYHKIENESTDQLKNTVSQSFIINFGHFKLKTSRDSLGQNNIYDDHHIIVKGLSAYISSSTAHKLQPKKSTLLQKIDIDLLFKILTTNDHLPRFKLNGKIPSIKLYLNQKKTLFILQLVNSMRNVVSLNIKKNLNSVKKSIKKKSLNQNIQYANGNNAIFSSQSDQSYIQIEDLEKKKILQCSFEISKLKVSLSHNTKSDDSSRKPFLVLNIESISSDFKKTSESLKIGLKLAELSLIDKYICESGIYNKAKGPYYLISTSSRKGEPLIDVQYRFSNVLSSKYDSARNFVNIKLNTIEFNVIRPTIALALNMIQSYSKLARKKGSLKKKSSKKSSIAQIEPSCKNNIQSNGSDIQFKICLFMKVLRVNLLRDGKQFFISRLSGFNIQFSRLLDGNRYIEAHFLSILAKDKNNIKWSNILQIEDDSSSDDKIENNRNPLAKFKMFMSKDNIDKYHCKTSIDLTVETMKMIILKRCFENLSTYFGGVKKMRDFAITVSKKATKKLKKKKKKNTIDSSQTDKRKKAILLNLCLNNSSICIPANSEDDIHLSLLFNMITIKNQFNIENGVYMDNIHIDFKDTTIITNVNDDRTTAKRLYTREIMNHFDFQLNVKRIVSGKSDVVPKLELISNIRKMNLSITEMELYMILGIFSGNLSELMVEKDEEMKEINFEISRRIQEEKKKEISLINMIPLINVAVYISIEDIDVLVYRGTGLDSKGNKTVGLSKVHSDLFELNVTFSSDMTRTLVLKIHEYVAKSCVHEGLTIASSGIKEETEIDGDKEKLYIFYKARPKDRYQVVNIRAKTPNVYIISNELQEFISFLQPLIKTVLKTISIYSKRSRFGSLKEREIMFKEHELLLRKKFEAEEMNLKNKFEEKLINLRKQYQKHEQLNEIINSELSRQKRIILKQRQENELKIIESIRNITKSQIRHRERTIKITILNPDIFIPDMKSNETIRLNMKETLVKLYIEPKYQSVEMHAYDFKINKTIMDEKFNIVDGNKVLLSKPFDIDLEMKRIKEPEQHVSNIFMNIGSMNMIISYRDIILSMTLAKRLLKALTKKKSKKKKKKIVELREQKSFNLNIGEASINVLNDSNLSLVAPLIKSNFKNIDLYVYHQTDGIRMNMCLNYMCIHSFNNDLDEYEPFIEPCSTELIMKKEMDKKMYFNLKFNDIVNINLTPSLIETYTNGVNFFQKIKQNKDNIDMENHLNLDESPVSNRLTERSFSPFLIKNKTCRNVQLVMKSNVLSNNNNINQNSIFSLKPDEEIPLNIDVDKHYHDGSKHTKIDAFIQFYNKHIILNDIPMDKIHKKTYFVSYEGKNYQFISSTTRHGGAKILTLKTSTMIINKTPFSLKITVQKESLDDYVIDIGDQDEKSIPVEYINHDSLVLKVDGYHEFKLNRKRNDQNQKQKSSYLCICEPEDQKTKFKWTCSILYENEEDEYSSCTSIRINPVFIIENLFSEMILYKFSDNDRGDSDNAKDLPSCKEREVFLTSSDSIMNDYLSFCAGGFYWSETVRLSSLVDSLPPPEVEGSGTRRVEKVVQLKDVINSREIDFFIELIEIYELSYKVLIYCPFWIINQTGLKLNLRTNFASKIIEDSMKEIEMKGDPRYFYIDGEKNTWKEYTPYKIFYSGKDLEIQVHNESNWSNSFTLAKKDSKKSTLDYDFYFQMESLDQTKLYEFYCHVKRAKGKFWRTQEIRIYPKYILINKSKENLVYTQDTGENKIEFVYELMSKDQIPFHWKCIDKMKEKKLMINFRDSTHPTNWSSSFFIDNMDHITLKLRRKDKPDEFSLIIVSVKIINGINYIIFRDFEENMITNYKIVNITNYDLQIQQKFSQPTSFYDVVQSNSTIPYFLDDPHTNQKQFIVSLKDIDSSPLWIKWEDDKVQKSIWKPSSNIILTYDIVTKGYTKVLTIRSANEKGSKDLSASTDSLSSSFSSTIDVPYFNDHHIEFEIDFKSIGLSLVDSFPQEIVYITFRNLLFNYSKMGKLKRIKAVIKKGQVDNQIYLSTDPILIYSLSEEDNFLETFVEMVRDSDDLNHQNITHFTKVFFKLNHLSLNLDQTSLLVMASFVSMISKVFNKRNRGDFIKKKIDIIPFLKEKHLKSDKSYFEEVKFEAMNPIFSLRRSFNTQFIPLLNQKLNTMLSRALKISSIERQRLKFNEFLCTSAFCSMKDMKRRILSHYKALLRSSIRSIVFNYFTKLARSILSSELVLPVIQQRPPRYFPPDNSVITYDLQLSYGQRLLRCITEGEFHKDHYFFHYFINKDHLLLASHKYIMLCECKDERKVILWKDRIDELAAYVLKENNIILYFVPKYDDDDPHQREIECISDDQIRFISSKLDVAVTRNRFSSITKIIDEKEIYEEIQK